jgi:DNA-binding response OmpR family regulator
VGCELVLGNEWLFVGYGYVVERPPHNWVAIENRSYGNGGLASMMGTRYKRERAQEVNLNERKVLVVDDDPGMREVLESILVLENAMVYTAVDGKDAVQKTLELMPDLILLDVSMPKLNGLTFCKAIRAGKDTKNIPIIMITSLTAPGRLEECMEAGADDFVGKPFAMSELLIRVRAMFKTAHVGNHVERMTQYILAVRDLREKAASELQP